MKIPEILQRMPIQHNVTLRVLNPDGSVAQEHTGHNMATNSMLTGIAHYLKGDGVLNQGYDMLNFFVPQYISLGTMGMMNQEEDSDYLPTGLGNGIKFPGESDEEFEIRRFQTYMLQRPGYGADGFDGSQNNGRDQFGLGYPYKEKVEKTGNGDAVNCELISNTFPRSKITYRNIIPEGRSELPMTIDVVFSAMISTGALAQFRNGNDYVFITECGLWSKPAPVPYGENGLLAGYRIAPPDSDNWDMTVAENREILKSQIIRVAVNQVVQVVWKVQLGSVDVFQGGSQL